MKDLSWVQEIKTVNAVDTTAVDALNANDGWVLLSVGVGKHGQTTLTYGWPSEPIDEPDEPSPAPLWEWAWDRRTLLEACRRIERDSTTHPHDILTNMMEEHLHHGREHDSLGGDDIEGRR